MNRILVASENDEAVQTLGESFEESYLVEAVDDEETLLSVLHGPDSISNPCELCFVDLSLLSSLVAPSVPNGTAKALHSLSLRFPGAEVVVMCHQKDSREAISAVKAGAHDYLIFPLDVQKVSLLRDRVEKRLRQRSELDYLREGFWKTDSLKLVRTDSPKMKRVFQQVRSVAPTLSTVLLIGETGTGKGVLARLIHMHSSRSGGPFISLHCGAIPDTLIESELFGHERGAFTGADRRKLGRFEIAKGGTIFLDEIATISPSVQIRLLQVLQERTFQRIGSENSIHADVRIIAATNEDLLARTQQGQFRKDLYFRLNVFPLELPPLRERTEDLSLLVEEFLAELNRIYGKGIRALDNRVMQAFTEYSWPGNIRELENLIERAYILESSKVLAPENFPTELLAFPAALAPETSTNLPTLSEARKMSVELTETQYLKEVLSLHRGRIDASARTAGISTRQLHKLMRKYSLRKEDFKEPAPV
jgi:DNA-binding NtrC family response regulator